MPSLQALGHFGHLNQKQSADGVVAAFVGILEIRVIPIMGVFPVVVPCPGLAAVDPVAKKGLVEVNQMHAGMLFGAAFDGIVAGIQYYHSIRPGRKSGPRDIADAIGRVID
jgi:hypothetical protein